MELTIYENAAPIGTLTGRREGLYWNFSCKLEKKTERPLRVYVLSMFTAEYLGIPDAEGQLTARIPARHFPAEPSGAIASPYPRGEWKPWRGELDGVAVDFCLLRQTEDGFTAALPPEEALKLPQWLEHMTQLTLFDQQWASVAMDRDGHLPPTETDNGGTEDETNSGNFTLGGLPADAAAGDGFGGDGWEADRADL